MQIDAGLTRRCPHCQLIGLLRDVPANGQRCLECRPPPPRLRLVRPGIPPRPMPGHLRFRGAPLPYCVVKVQVLRALRSSFLPPRMTKRCESWLTEQSLSAAARRTNCTAQTVRSAVLYALEAMWRRDQRTNPGEVWCDEQQ